MRRTVQRKHIYCASFVPCLSFLRRSTFFFFFFFFFDSCSTSSHSEKFLAYYLPPDRSGWTRQSIATALGMAEFGSRELMCPDARGSSTSHPVPPSVSPLQADHFDTDLQSGPSTPLTPKALTPTSATPSTATCCTASRTSAFPTRLRKSLSSSRGTTSRTTTASPLERMPFRRLRTRLGECL